jgi:hypothetical protein
MKTLNLCIAFSMLLMIACTKSSDPTPTSTSKTKTEYLTAHPWKYDELFNNYSQTNTTVPYKRGKANNLYNLDNDVYTYHANGTFNTVLGASPFSQAGTWKFINNETQLQITITSGGSGTYTGTIVQLDDKNYVFSDAGANSYGKLIAQ